MARRLMLQGREHRRPPIQVGSHYHFFETNEALSSSARKRAAFG